ncbi:PREDICTED: uncharacterized protein LOC106812546 [Priapulus caudatus]|uniref:Uncharacterized protein LOC106812546 n=1 Tax=Priapulus caudatus TaxID=37621 RepID=A0ABM1EIA7_PRICU|nr:PREDICTED: uncharacterized protein LOC106812546 [Priapulus caudatus]
MFCGKFAIDRQMVQDFESGPELSIDEALGSPKRRRMSVSGTVSDVVVTEAVAGPSNEQRQRAQFSIGAVGSPRKLPIKLWGEQAKELHVKEGDVVTIKDLEIGEFGSRKEANLTRTTKIEVTSALDEEIEQQGVVSAIDIDGETVTVEISMGRTSPRFKMNSQVLCELGEEDYVIERLDSLHVTFTVRNGEIVQIRYK